MAENLLKRALDHAQARNQATAEIQYRLGRVYWSRGGEFRVERPYALGHLLAAAGAAGPWQSSAFAWVGHFYKDVACDLPRAQKCYQVRDPLGSEGPVS